MMMRRLELALLLRMLRWGLMFADDFVGLTTSAEGLQTLIIVEQQFCNKWRLKSNIKKCCHGILGRGEVKKFQGCKLMLLRH